MGSCAYNEPNRLNACISHIWFLVYTDHTEHRMWTAVRNPERSNSMTQVHLQTASYDYCKQNFGEYRMEGNKEMLEVSDVIMGR